MSSTDQFYSYIFRHSPSMLMSTFIKQIVIYSGDDAVDVVDFITMLRFSSYVIYRYVDTGLFGFCGVGEAACLGSRTS